MSPVWWDFTQNHSRTSQIGHPSQSFIGRRYASACAWQTAWQAGSRGKPRGTSLCLWVATLAREE
jgi:hypothetical protein